MENHRDFNKAEEDYIKTICSDLLKRYEDETDLAFSIATNIFINVISNLYAQHPHSKEQMKHFSDFMCHIVDKTYSQIDLVRKHNERD